MKKKRREQNPQDFAHDDSTAQHNRYDGPA
jgi:hypothetical protein